jgi:hypothetical protein
MSSDIDSEASDEQIDVCPMCDGTNWTPRTTQQSEDKYYCSECSEPFEKLDSRDSLGGTEPRHGLAYDLYKADPEEVSR